MVIRGRRWIELGYRPDVLDGPLSVWLDHFRWIAALVVASSHLRNLIFPDAGGQVLGKAQKLFYFATLFADEAVVVFFVLSGLLVGGTILRDLRAGTFRPGAYAINRAARLYVALVPAVVLAVVLQHVQGTVACRHGPDSPLHVLGNLVYLQNFVVAPLCNDHPLWSLSSEAYFYLIAPALLIAIIRPTLRTLALAALALAPTVIWLRFDYLTPALGMLLWMMGVLVWLVRIRLAWWLALVPFAAVLLLGRGHVFPHRFEEELCLGPAFVLFLCSDFAALPARGATWARRLAGFSYSLYLTHMPLAQVTAFHLGWRALSPGRWASYAIYAALLLLMVATGWLFGAVFERRTGQLRRAMGAIAQRAGGAARAAPARAPAAP